MTAMARRPTVVNLLQEFVPVSCTLLHVLPDEEGKPQDAGLSTAQVALLPVANAPHSMQDLVLLLLAWGETLALFTWLIFSYSLAQRICIPCGCRRAWVACKR